MKVDFRLLAMSNKKFKDIRVGECFHAPEYPNVICMKTAPIHVNLLSKCNAINLTTGETRYFSEDSDILHLDCKLDVLGINDESGVYFDDNDYNGYCI